MVDLHLAYGDAAIYLAAEPRFSIADALENVHRLDASILEEPLRETTAGRSCWRHRIGPGDCG